MKSGVPERIEAGLKRGSMLDDQHQPQP